MTTAPVKQRIASIDALRGFDMFWIIGGDAFFRSFVKAWPNGFTKMIDTQLVHPPWEGFVFYDLIMPLFLFIIGLVMPFSLLKHLNEGQSRKKIYFHVIRRTLILLFMGWALSGFFKFDLPNIRWFGVLPRIAWTYLLTSLIVMNTKPKTQAIIAPLILLAYWAAMMLIPVPGYGLGVLTPQGCLHTYIDQQLIPGGVFSDYFYKYGDACGIMGTFNSVAISLFGVLAGYWLKTDNSGNKKTLCLLASGIISLAIGYLWWPIFPVIKMIWTSSYVMISLGYSLLLLALFYWVIDVKCYKKWAFFFIVIGANPITIYFLQGFIKFGDFGNMFLAGIALNIGAAAPLIYPLGEIATKWLFLYFLYKKKIFLKV